MASPLPKIKETNDTLIETLFDKFRKTKTGLAKRLRARAIFKEIDFMSTQDFNKLISISRDRFVHVKAGNEMNKELSRSSTMYKTLAKKLYEKEMYNNSNELKCDKQGLKENKSSKVNEEIFNLFKTIKGTFYLNVNKISNEVGKNVTTNKTNVLGGQTMNKSKSTADVVRNHENYLKEYFENERQQFLRNMGEYMRTTQQLKTTNEERNKEDKTPTEKKKKENEFQIKTLSFLHKLQLLNYKKPVPQVKVVKKQEKKEFNITKLMRYTRSRSFLEQNNIKTEKENLRASNVSNSSNQTGKILEQEIANVDYSDTIGLVKKQISEEEKIKETFKERLNNLNSLVNVELPSIDDYVKIIQKIEQNKELAKRNKKTKEELKREKIIENGTPFFRSLSEVYNRKRKKWKEEEEEEKQKEIAEKEVKQKCLQFLRQLNQTKRNVSRYSDPYSLRDGTVNKCLNDISLILGKKLFTKEEMKEQAESYYKFYSEKEKIEKEEIDRKYKSQLLKNDELRSSQKKQTIYDSNILLDDIQFNNTNEENEIDFSFSYKNDIDAKRLQRSHSTVDNSDSTYYQEFLSNKFKYEKKQSVI